MVQLNVGATGTPAACATSTSYKFAMLMPDTATANTTNTWPSNALATLLTAHAAGRTVSIAGTGACTVPGATAYEAISVVVME